MTTFLAKRDVLVKALRDVLHDPAFMTFGFALADGYDDANGKFSGLAVPLEDHDFGQVTDTTLLVRPDLAVAQRERNRTVVEAPSEMSENELTPCLEAGGGGGHGSGRVVPPTHAMVHDASYSVRFTLDTEEDLPVALKELAEEILVHLQAARPDVLEIPLDVHAERAKGCDPSTVRIVRGNVGQFGCIRNRFEDA